MVVIVKASQLGNQTNLGDGGSLGLEGGYGEEPQENTEQYGVVMLVVPITTRGDTQSVGICTLTVVDAIGLAFGDSNYAFGSVDDVYIGPEGRTYVLDKTQLTVFVYDAAGIILRTEYWFMPDLSIGPLEENIREWIEAMDVYVNGNLDMIPLGE